MKKKNQNQVEVVEVVDVNEEVECTVVDNVNPQANAEAKAEKLAALEAEKAEKAAKKAEKLAQKAAEKEEKLKAKLLEKEEKIKAKEALKAEKLEAKAKLIEEKAKAQAERYADEDAAKAASISEEHPEGIEHKKCGHCGGLFPITDFYKSPNLRKGVRNNCKACDKAACDASRKKAQAFEKEIIARIQAEAKANAEQTEQNAENVQ